MSASDSQQVVPLHHAERHPLFVPDGHLGWRLIHGHLLVTTCLSSVLKQCILLYRLRHVLLPMIVQPPGLIIEPSCSISFSESFTTGTLVGVQYLPVFKASIRLRTAPRYLRPS